MRLLPVIAATLLLTLILADDAAAAGTRSSNWTDPSPQSGLWRKSIPFLASAGVRFDTDTGTVGITLRFTRPVSRRAKEDPGLQFIISGQYFSSVSIWSDSPAPEAGCNWFNQARYVAVDVSIAGKDPSTVEMKTDDLAEGRLLDSGSASWNAARDVLTWTAQSDQLVGYPAVCWSTFAENAGVTSDDFYSRVYDRLFDGMRGLDGDLVGAATSGFRGEVSDATNTSGLPGLGRLNDGDDMNTLYRRWRSAPHCRRVDERDVACAVRVHVPFIIGRPGLVLTGYTAIGEDTGGDLDGALSLAPRYTGRLHWQDCPYVLDHKHKRRPCTIPISWTTGKLRDTMRASVGT